MSDGKIICSNCRQLVTPVALGAVAACCPVCNVQFALPGTATAPSSTRSIPPVLITTPVVTQPPTGPTSALHPAEIGLTAGNGVAAKRNKPPRSVLWEIAKVVLGGGAGLGIGYLVVLWIQHRHPSPPKSELREPRAQQAVARVPSRDRLPEFRPELPRPSTPIVPAFTPPPIDFAPPPTTPQPVVSSGPAVKQGNSESAPAAPPPTTKHGLAQLPPALKLPALVDTSAVVLCPFHVPAGQVLELSLNAVAANIASEAALLVERNPSGSNAWLFAYAPDVNNAAQGKKTLAEIKHTNEELIFTWRNPIEDATARKELANCVLRLACENTVKTVSLRVPQEMPRLKVDLERDVSTHSLAALDLPNEASLRLEIAELTGFPDGARVRDDKHLLRLKERATVEFAQMPGAEIQLEFRRHPMGELQVVMRPEFRENAAEKVAMTIPRLADLKKGLEKSIPEGEARLVALDKEARALDDQLQNLGPRPGGAAFVAWQAKRTRLESAVSSCRSQASRLQRRLPEMKARLAAAPRLQDFLSGLQQRSSLRIRVIAECGDWRPVIVDARLEPGGNP